MTAWREVSLGALWAFFAVALGAFGAHGLRDALEPADLELWRTGVRYQVWHALALVLHGLFRHASGTGALPGGLFAGGSALFSGSLYALALGALPSVFGPLTPLGGLLLLAGWLGFAVQAHRAIRT